MSTAGQSAESKSSPESSGQATAGRTRESLWKRSKRTLGTTQFAFLQGKVAGDVSEKDEKGDKSAVAPSKRREQVRRAQRTHRQRTEAYVKTLEEEVVRLRKSEAIALRKNADLQAELDQLKQFVSNSQGGLIPGQGGSSTQLSVSSTANETMAVDTSDMTKSVGVKFYESEGVLTLGTDRNNFNNFNPLPHFRNSAFNTLDVSGINLNDEYDHPPPPPPKNKDRVVLVSDDYQTGIDFVLLLEQPCIPHLHSHRFPAENSTESTGHVLTASVSLIQQYEGPNGVQPGTSWAVTPNDIERLLYLSSRIQLQGEITPVEAWNRVRLHPGFRNLSLEAFEKLKGELKGLVTCYGFGAALDELTFHTTVDRVLYSGNVF